MPEPRPSEARRRLVNVLKGRGKKGQEHINSFTCMLSEWEETRETLFYGRLGFPHEVDEEGKRRIAEELNRRGIEPSGMEMNFLRVPYLRARNAEEFIARLPSLLEPLEKLRRTKK